MSILDDMLKEELEKLHKIMTACEEELENLPKGSIVLKKINGKPYPYLQYRAGDKIKSDYIKKTQLEDMKKSLARRKELEQEIKRVISDKNKIDRVVKSE